MAETKDNTLSIIALVALVAVVGMVVAFAVSSKGSTQTAATPVYMTAPSGEATNSAGQMRWGGQDDDEMASCKSAGLTPCATDADCTGKGTCGGGAPRCCTAG